MLIDLQEGILKMDYAPYTAGRSEFKTLINRIRSSTMALSLLFRVNFYDGKDVLQPNAMISLPPKEGDDYIVSRFIRQREMTICR